MTITTHRGGEALRQQSHGCLGVSVPQYVVLGVTASRFWDYTVSVPARNSDRFVNPIFS
jgi:hypothetical protein